LCCFAEIDTFPAAVLLRRAEGGAYGRRRQLEVLLKTTLIRLNRGRIPISSFKRGADRHIARTRAYAGLA